MQDDAISGVESDSKITCSIMLSMQMQAARAQKALPHMLSNAHSDHKLQAGRVQSDGQTSLHPALSTITITTINGDQNHQ